MGNTPPHTGYAPINGQQMYYEIHGTGQPTILLHGGLGLTSMFGEVLPLLAANRQIIAVDLQAHGRTEDIDRPMSLEAMGDDVAALIQHLGFAQADVVGYSMGGAVAIRTAIQHPDLVRKLVAVSVPFKRSGWYPEMQAGMASVNGAAAPYMQNTPMYQAYASAAPKVENFPTLLDKMGVMMGHDYDWTTEVAGLKMPVLIAIGDADGIPPSHAAEFFALLGGGLRDGSWDGSGMSKSQLAILPGLTHYTIFSSPALAGVITPFLDAPLAETKPEDANQADWTEKS